ncbi:hypothetical protein AVEN_162311-1 [Araneus ventricosus]|uniref:Uncharacterized protein n=1 Tax=Araneus ventricosus TaxID=182803 RepID=A0A4Y2LWP2_ARAVE|nr:hypothetical protein AVEN_162311-1 [Araneus ventricosus]
MDTWRIFCSLVASSSRIPYCSSSFIGKLCPFFTWLRQKDRENILAFLNFTNSEDYWICLHAAATKEEEEQILNIGSSKLLFFYLETWPLQSFFFDMAEKVWHFLTPAGFTCVIMEIWFYYEARRQDFDYFKVDFWNRSPINLREIVIEISDVRKMVISCFNTIKRKRKNEFSSDINRKKWSEKNGRLGNLRHGYHNLLDIHKIVYRHQRISLQKFGTESFSLYKEIVLSSSSRVSNYSLNDLNLKLNCFCLISFLFLVSLCLFHLLA